MTINVKRSAARTIVLFPLLTITTPSKYTESLYPIGLGLDLRFLTDTTTEYHGLCVDGILIGLWEGIVLNHFARQSPSSFDPYIAFAFRVFTDILLTKNFSKIAIVILRTGLLGMVLSDVFPEVKHHKHLWNSAFSRRTQA